MCGIAGIVGGPGAARHFADRAELMRCALRHRGPDDSGVWTSPHGDAVFAHTRLAIIDPTPAGRQPMSIDAHRLTITFNGEIYNFQELRRELEQRGASFQSRTDTEVILHAYDAWGAACVERLRGMFAFAIWDERARQCIVARDRFGIKPLYYALHEGMLIFASELRAIMATSLVPATVDSAAAYEYFRTGTVAEPATLLSSVRCLEGGAVAVFQGGHLKRSQYFDLSFAPHVHPAAAASATRDALRDSVAHHFVSDVPVGIFLSGGVDSTALLALARETGHGDTRALTMAMPGSDADESVLARRTAAHFGVRHDVCDVDEESGRVLFDDYLDAMDQPSIDGMNTLAVSTLAQSCGVKVMLSGVGADELFGGYPSTRAIPAFSAWHRRLALAGPLTTAAGHVLERMPDPRWRRIGDMLAQEPAMATTYAAYRGIFTRAEARQLTQQFVGALPAIDDQPAPESVDPTPEDAACRLELTKYLRNQLLRDADVMSMARGVEVRVPFVDSRVIETVTAIPTLQRVQPAKALLRQAVPEIPAWIAAQPKRGFMFPMERWLNGAWRGVFDGTDARTTVPTGTWYRKWCVHALRVWIDRLRESPSDAGARSTIAVNQH